MGHYRTCSSRSDHQPLGMNVRDYLELYRGPKPNGKGVLAFLPLGS
jgi:hypothetical protein